MLFFSIETQEFHFGQDTTSSVEANQTLDL